MKSWWVLLAFLPSLAGSDGDRLFFLNDDTHYIEAVNLDGSGRSRVAIPTVVFPHHIALDHGAGKIYWVDEAVRLNRADLDGGNMEPMYDSVGRAISDLELDLVHQKMYWPVEGELLRANLDGSQIESVNGAVSVHHLTLDLAAGHIYFIETGGNRISRMNLDGSGLTNLLDGLGGPLAGIVLDPVAGNMYWSNGGLDVIQRADLSGGEVENLPISGLNSVEVVGLDPLGQKLYWVDYIFSRIQRSDLDGANQEDLLTSADTIRGVTLDFKGDQFFWGSSPKIQKRAIGGGAITEVMRGQVFNPVDIDVDRVQKKVYWVDADTQTAFRANYDGSAMESLPIPIPRPLTLAVDALAKAGGEAVLDQHKSPGAATSQPGRQRLGNPHRFGAQPVFQPEHRCHRGETVLDRQRPHPARGPGWREPGNPYRQRSANPKRLDPRHRGRKAVLGGFFIRVNLPG